VAPLSEILDGFWMPSHLRHLLQHVEWETHGSARPAQPAHGWAAHGSTRSDGEARATPERDSQHTDVRVRWPIFDSDQWQRLLTELRSSRGNTSQGTTSADILERWQSALSRVPGILMSQIDALDRISDYTGFSKEMFAEAFSGDSFFNPSQLAEYLKAPPTWSAMSRWGPMPGNLPGLCRFFPDRAGHRWAASLRAATPLFTPLPAGDLGLGIAAGNVPGNGLLLAMLLHISNHMGGSDAVANPPAVLVRNSRQAPILAPWVLSAIEGIDPELVSGIAMLMWDYENEEIQQMLLKQAHLVIAAAADPTIDQIKLQLKPFRARTRFHAHGHKVSFAVIGREALRGTLANSARLAALDSILWDQYGCLSARIHFVEMGGSSSYQEYSQALTEKMRFLSMRLRRGVAPRRYLHRAYESYKLLESNEEVQVFSDYEDDFLVVCDRREWSPYMLRESVNRCTGRVIVVRPVSQIEHVPPLYLSKLPPANLQTLGIACSAERIRQLAQRSGACGVTALRCLGRAAFPQLAYSWDGYLPLDLGSTRPPGYFSTVEEVDPLNRIRV